MAGGSSVRSSAGGSRWPVVFALAVLPGLAGWARGQPPPLPERVSLVEDFRALGLAPGSQGARDTCSLFAITALADFEWARRMPGGRGPLSVEFLVWAANEACGREGDQAMFYEATHGLDARGVCARELMPYAEAPDPGRRPSAAALADARARAGRWRVRWIRRWDVRRPMGDAELRAIREALAGGHPVACGLRWPRAKKGHQLLDVPAADQVVDGHSVAFVGYADDARQNGGGVFVFRNSSGAGWGDGGHGTMSYAYARAYANDALWLELGPPGSEVPLDRFEAESLPVLDARRCEAAPAGMQPWGGGMWSGATQLLGRARQGGYVELSFTVRKAARRRLRLLATAAPDHGEVGVTLDGAPVAGRFDLYAGRVCPAGSLELGAFDLAAGPHRLRVRAEGRNAASAGFGFGLDAIDLLPAGAPSDVAPPGDAK